MSLKYDFGGKMNTLHQVVIQHVVQVRLWINSRLECTQIVLLLANSFLTLSFISVLKTKLDPFHKNM